MSGLRKLLGGDVIATILGGGYRFAAVADAPPVAPTAPRSDGGDGMSSAPPIGQPPGEPVTEVVAPLIGREDELVTLLALLREQRVITVVGAGEADTYCP